MNLQKNDTNNLIAALANVSQVDLVCLSHLRWDFVYQRPQHLLSRFAKERRVFFVEEPTFGEGPMRLDVTVRECGVHVVVPRLPQALESEGALDVVQRGMVERLFTEHGIVKPILWYYTPMAMSWTRELQAVATVYNSPRWIKCSFCSN